MNWDDRGLCLGWETTLCKTPYFQWIYRKLSQTRNVLQIFSIFSRYQEVEAHFAAWELLATASSPSTVTHLRFVGKCVKIMRLSVFHYWFVSSIQGSKAEEQNPGKWVLTCPEDWEKNATCGQMIKRCGQRLSTSATKKKRIFSQWQAKASTTTSGLKLSPLENLFGLGGQIKIKRDNGSGVMGVSGISLSGWQTNQITT